MLRTIFLPCHSASAGAVLESGDIRTSRRTRSEDKSLPLVFRELTINPEIEAGEPGGGLTFGGPEHDTLYVGCASRVFARKTQAKGASVFK
jgi:hypothetical protein